MVRLALLTTGLVIICTYISSVDSWNYSWYNIGSNQDDNIDGNDIIDDIGSSDDIAIDGSSQQLDRIIEENENLFNTLQTIQNVDEPFNQRISRAN